MDQPQVCLSLPRPTPFQQALGQLDWGKASKNRLQSVREEKYFSFHTAVGFLLFVYLTKKRVGNIIKSLILNLNNAVNNSAVMDGLAMKRYELVVDK